MRALDVEFGGPRKGCKVVKIFFWRSVLSKQGFYQIFLSLQMKKDFDMGIGFLFCFENVDLQKKGLYHIGWTDILTGRLNIQANKVDPSAKKVTRPCLTQLKKFIEITPKVGHFKFYIMSGKW